MRLLTTFLVSFPLVLGNVRIRCYVAGVDITVAHKLQPIAHNKLLYSTMDSLPQQRNKRLLARPFSKSNKSQKSGKGEKSSKSSSTSSVSNGGGKSSKGYQLFISKANKSSKGGVAADNSTLTKSGKSDTKAGKGFKVSR